MSEGSVGIRSVNVRVTCHQRAESLRQWHGTSQRELQLLARRQLLRHTATPHHRFKKAIKNSAKLVLLCWLVVRCKNEQPQHFALH